MLHNVNTHPFHVCICLPWSACVGEDLYGKNCNTLQHTASHCNTLQLTATHCNSLQHTHTHTPTSNTLQRTAAHSNALQHTATHCSTHVHTYAQSLAAQPAQPVGSWPNSRRATHPFLPQEPRHDSHTDDAICVYVFSGYLGWGLKFEVLVIILSCQYMFRRVPPLFLQRHDPQTFWVIMVTAIHICIYTKVYI